MAQLKGTVLAGKVLVKPQEAEGKTASGIIIPESAKEKPRQGTIILVGGPKRMKKSRLKKAMWFFMENIPDRNSLLTGMTICLFPNPIFCSFYKLCKTN
jgi:hypothetical protein